MVHAQNIRQRIRQATLAAICEVDEAALASAGDALEVEQTFTDYEELLACDEIDAVLIAAPTFLHESIARAAAQAGKHIFLEKPMAITVAQCHSINQAVQKAGVILQLGFMRRFDACHLRARELVCSGDMGRIMIIKSTGRGPNGPGPWMWDLQKSNGIIAEVNSHDIDSLQWFVGSPFTRVHAEAHNFKMDEARKHFPDFYDNVVATFRFADGTIGVIDGTCPAHYGYDARVEILCERGVVFIGSSKELGVECVALEHGTGNAAVRSWQTLFKAAYQAELEHFVHCVHQNQVPCVSGDDGLRAVAAAVAVNESIRTGKPVEIAQEAGQ
jgi:myo-inositol 2-dehydrogenase/D-chiro-inositol 1-dehydrogenase/scyllo-inositol 2-dehydrogenase (NAD+)